MRSFTHLIFIALIILLGGCHPQTPPNAEWINSEIHWITIQYHGDTTHQLVSIVSRTPGVRMARSSQIGPYYYPVVTIHYRVQLTPEWQPHAFDFEAQLEPSERAETMRICRDHFESIRAELDGQPARIYGIHGDEGCLLRVDRGTY